MWPHDYLRDALASYLSGPDEERLTCAMLGMTEDGYVFLSGAAASIYGEESSF